MYTNLHKILKIVIGIIICITFILGIILYFMTDLFKSKELLFKKYFFQNIDNMLDIVDISRDESIIDFLNNNDHVDSLEADINYTKNKGDETENYVVFADAIINNSENNAYINMDAKYNEEELVKLELLEQDNIYGVRLVDLLKPFISVENDNLQFLISKLGYNGLNIQDSLSKINFTEIMTFTDDEIKELKNIYGNCIFRDIDKNSYNSKKSIITLANGTSLNTTAYSMTINQNELNKIYKRLINNSIDNEIILKKLEMVDNKILESGISNVYNVKEIFINTLKQMSELLDYKGIDDRQVIFTVYVYNGEAVSTRIERQDIGKVAIDKDMRMSNAYNIILTKYTEQGTDTNEYYASLDCTQNGLIREFKCKDNNNNLKISYEVKQESEYIEILSNIVYSNSFMAELEVNTVLKSDFGTKKDINTKFSNSNNIVINNYDEESINKIISVLKNRCIDNFEKKQSTLNTKMIYDILNWVNFKEKQIQEEEQNNKELQKKRFNNKFELYAGKELTINEIERMFSVVRKNTTGYLVLENNKIKIDIASGKTANDKMDKLENALKNLNKKYNVELGYSDEGYINSIYIIITK